MASALVGRTYSEGIQEFVPDLLNYIWTQHKFRSSNFDKQFAEMMSSRLEEPLESKSSPFTEDIGKAVLTTQYLLRDICIDLFRRFEKYMLHCKKSYIFCVNLTHYICCEFRSTVFTRFIDICAIIAEAFLYCDCLGKPMMELHEVPETLVGFFEIHISQSFFLNGGWKELRALSREYSRTGSFLENYIHKVNIPYVSLHYDCKLIKVLRECKVPFPVHYRWICEDCTRASDRDCCISFKSDITIETFIARYGLIGAPWENEEVKEVSFGPEAAGASNRSSAEREMCYIFVGRDEEISEQLEREKKKKKAEKRRQQRRNKRSPRAASECSTSKET